MISFFHFVKYGDKNISENIVSSFALRLPKSLISGLNLERKINLLVNKRVDVLKIAFFKNTFQKFLAGVHPKDKISFVPLCIEQSASLSINL